MKYSFKNDYSELGNPEVLEALKSATLEQNDGYGLDKYSIEAAQLIKTTIKNPSAEVYLVSGGTQANKLVLASLLKPYECVLAVKSGHINVHEAGAIESTGHKVEVIEGVDGKATVEQLTPVLELLNSDDHMVKAGALYISQTTELGTVYTKAELQALSHFCKRNKIYLFIDGARLGAALASEMCDHTMSDLAELADVFYIGGTKNGAMLGEAIVIINDQIKIEFTRYIKQHGALLAKGQLIGLQFKTLFTNELYMKNANHGYKMAMKLADGIKALGYKFLTRPESNQIFPILNESVIRELGKDYGFYVWSRAYKSNSTIRLVTSWATDEQMVEEFLSDLKSLS